MFRLMMVVMLGLASSLAHAESWVLVLDLWGNPVYQVLTLKRQGDSLSGDLDGDKLSGRREGETIRFTVADDKQASSEFKGRLEGDRLIGSAEMPDTNDPKARAVHAFSARRVPDRPEGPPRLHEFKPTVYSNEFSPHRPPVLTIWPRDSVHTTTLDSGGVDERGITRALFGNPQTGPFFIAGAQPGDVLAIRLDRVRLNRDWADSLDAIVGRAQTTGLAAKSTALGKPVRWTLDRENGLARPTDASAQLKGFSVPLRPMLGGLAVAPGFGAAPISTGDTGRFGGNMDFNEVIEGSTIYLPVNQPGALLYLGDAHAAQGDGETSQYALETSMDVTFTVDVLPRKALSTPRVESPTHLMALGQAGSLDDALRQATAGLTQWLEQDYGLSLSDSAQVLGSAVEYVVANLAGRSVGVAAKLNKARLAKLTRK